ncbi:MAG TPA: TIGR02300 family protein [Alphaproteobacteria bacterium]|nr:TIGR02300 family protein [Alphaproteobacteria bacterium]
MVKAEWGLKRICPNCGTRYYDFRKDPPTCPACGTVYDPEALLKSRRARPGMAEEPRKASKAPARGFDEIAPADAEEDVDLVPDADEEDDGASLIEDPGELGEDDAIEEVEVESRDDEE